jgi:VanZ family protein
MLMRSRLSWQWIATALLVVVVLFALLIAPIGIGGTELQRAIKNAAHGPLFALLAIVVLQLLRRAAPDIPTFSVYGATWLVTVALGALTEFAQALTGSRHAEWLDWFYDVAGATSGLALFTYFDSAITVSRMVKRASVMLGIVSMSIVIVPVALAVMNVYQRNAQLPALVTWEREVGHHFLAMTHVVSKVVNVPSEWAHQTTELALHVLPAVADTNGDAVTERWPGIALEEPWGRWNEYTALAIDVVNPNDVELRLHIRINDQQHSGQFADRFNRSVGIAPRARVVIELSLADIAQAPVSRVMDMSNIAKLVLFQDGKHDVLPFYVCHLRLIP